MSEIKINISLPLDDDGFFRRQCPFCCREFKVLLEKEELDDFVLKGIDSFMIEQQEKDVDSGMNEYSETEFTCPYCEQCAPHDSWWTQEQHDYIRVYVENIAAKIINEKLIRPLKREFSGSRSGPISINFKGEEMKQKEPWISPEPNDLEIFNLPCCNRKLKIQEDWKKEIYCFFCGFPHKNK